MRRRTLSVRYFTSNRSCDDRGQLISIANDYPLHVSSLLTFLFSSLASAKAGAAG